MAKQSTPPDLPAGLPNPEVKPVSQPSRPSQPLPTHEVREPRWQQIGSLLIAGLFALYFIYVLVRAIR